jgi:adenylosuccinate lyase
MTRESLHQFIEALPGIPEPERKRLLALTPASYIGKAAELAKKV